MSVQERSITTTFRANIASYQAAMLQMKTTTKDVTRELTHLSAKGQANFQQLGIGVGIAGAAMALGMGKAVNAAMDFDREMSAVAASSNATAGEMMALRQSALDAGAATAFSAREAAQAQVELAKAGVATADILGGALDGALDLAAAGQLGVARSAEIAATAMTQFRLSGDQVPHIADLLASGANKAQGSVEDMGQALNQAGLVSSQFGNSIESTVGTLSAFASAGMTGSDAGTSFRTMLLRMANPTDEVADLMADLGIAAYDTSGAFVGMESLAGQLQERLSGLTQAQRDQALALIFGQDAIRGANILYTQGAQGIRDWTASVNDRGAAARTAATLLDNLSGDIEAFTGSIDTAMIGFGEQGDGALRKMVQTGTALVNVFGALPDGVQTAGFVIGGVATTAAVASSALLLGVSAINKYQTHLAGAGDAAVHAAAAFKRVGRAAIGPWGLATVGVGLFTAGLLEAKQNIEEVTAAIALIDNVEEKFARSQQAGANIFTLSSGVRAEQLGAAIRAAAAESPVLARGLIDVALASGEYQRAVDGTIQSLKWETVITAEAARSIAQSGEGIYYSLIKSASAGATAATALGLTGTAAENYAAAVDKAAGTTATTLQDWAKAHAVMLDSYGQFRDASTTYQTLLEQENAARRKSADAAERDYTDMTDSLALWSRAIEQDNAAQARYYENLDAIREAHGSAVAEWIATETAGRPALLQQMVDAEQTVITNAWASERAGRARHAAFVLEEMSRSGHAAVNSFGGLTQDAVDAMSDALGLSKDEIRDIFDDNERTVEASFALMTAMAGDGTGNMVEAMVRRLELGAGEVATIVREYANLLKAGLDPIIVSVGGKPVAMASGSDYGLHRRGLNSGGFVGGPRTHADTVPAMLTPGEFVQPEPVVDYYGLDFMEALRARRIPRGYNAGGFVSDGVPRPPQMPHSGAFAQAGAATTQRMYEAATAFVKTTMASGNALARVHQMMAGLAGLSISSTYRTPAHNRAVGGAPNSYHLDRANPAVDVVGPTASLDALYARLSGSGRELLWRTAGHFDHLHYANRGGLVPGSPLNPHIRDAGGPLLPGYTFNGTGRPETVVPASGASAGSGFGPLTVGFDSSAIMALISGAGGTAEALQAALDAAKLLNAEWEDGIRLQDENRQRMDLLAERAKAEGELIKSRGELAKATGDERVRAAEAVASAEERVGDSIRAVQDFDVDRARAAQERAIAEIEAAAEIEQARREDIESNRAAMDFERLANADRLAQLDYLIDREQEGSEARIALVAKRERVASQSVDAQIAEIDRLLAAEDAYTDEWVSLQERRQRLVEANQDRQRRASLDALRSADSELSVLNRVLDEESRIRAQMSDAERQYARQRGEIMDRHNAARLEAETRFGDARVRIIADRERELEGFARLNERAEFGFGNRVESLIRNAASQVGSIEMWRDALSNLRARGLSEEIIAALGLDDPRQLNQAMMLARATDQQLAEYNAVVSRRTATINQVVAAEADLLIGEVGRGISEAQSAYQRSLDESYGRMVTDLAELKVEFETRTAELRDTLSMVGVDTGRSYAGAIAAGLEAGLPGIDAQVKRVQASLRELETAQARADRAERESKSPPLASSSPSAVGPSRATLEKRLANPNTSDAYRKIYQEQLAKLPKAHSGLSEVPGSGESPWMLQGGERVFSRYDNAQIVQAVRSPGIDAGQLAAAIAKALGGAGAGGGNGPLVNIENAHMRDGVDIDVLARRLAWQARGPFG